MKYLPHDGTIYNTNFTDDILSVEWIVHNGVMKDLSVLQEPPFTDQGSIQVLVYKNKCTKLSSGASLNPQLSGEVHTPVGPQTFMGLVGH